MSENNSLHYYMVAGHVIIKDGEDVRGVMANAVLTTDGHDHHINVHALGKAQQALQISVSKKLGETPEVVDVILMSLIDLGSMTPEEFNAPPPGLEVKAVTVDPNDPYADEIIGRVTVQ
jgi:hypothetical protein